MILPTFSLLPAILALFGVQSAAGVSVSRMVVRNEIVLRVPVVRQRVAWPVRWVEKRGPKCIASTSVIAASLHDESSIDFLLRDRRRIRARMDSDCPTLDFYGGFYLQPEEPGRICAGRDEVRNRMGGTCRIDRFRLMVPRPVK